MSLLEELVDELREDISLGERFAREVWPNDGRTTRHNTSAAITHDGLFEVRTLVDSSSAWGVPASQPSLTAPVFATRVGDLFVRVPTNAGVVVSTREINFVDNGGGASAVAEGAEKPEITLQFERDLLAIKKVAAVGHVTREVLEDADGLRDYCDRRLMDFVRIREADQILNGDGTDENMLGLRSVNGVQTQSFATSATETIARAIEKVELVDGIVDGVVIHPSSYRVAALAAPSFWSDLKSEIRVVRCRDVGANKAIVGSFRTAAAIRERSTTIRFSDSNETDFVAGMIAIVGERREQLATSVPSWFCDATLA